MRDLAIAYGNSRQAKKWSNKTVKFYDLKKRLQSTMYTTESVEEYKKMSKAQRDAAKDHGGFVAGVLKGGRRKVDTVEKRSMIALDGDRITKEFLDDYENIAPYTSALYTTHSSTVDDPRVRLIFPLTRDITSEEFVAVSRYLAQMLGIDMFDEYLDGKSFKKIKLGLEADGILNGAKHEKWHDTNIRQILTNEKYIGDALLQKTYTVSVLDKKRVPNNGLVPKYYVEGSHEAIIDKETFLRVQAELARRSSIKTGEKKRTYSSKYALSSRVFCGHCGDIYRRIAWNNRGYRSIVWRCVSRVEKKKSGIDCPARTLREEDLHGAVVTAVNDAWSRKDSVLAILKENIRSVLNGDIEDKVAGVDKAIRDKQAELLEAGNDQNLIEEIGDAIINLREERQSILTEVALKHDLQERTEDLIAFLNEQTEAVTEYSEPLARRLIEKITVYDEKLVVEFKSGLTVEVEA